MDAEDVNQVKCPHCETLVTMRSYRGRFGLTKREATIADLVVGGMKYRKIAVMLDIAQPTVRKHLSNAFNKIGCGTNVELLAWAIPERKPLWPF